MYAVLQRWFIGALLLAGSLPSLSPAVAADLVVDVGSKRTLTTEQLLARPDVATIQVPGDITYHRTMTYRAVPLRALLGAGSVAADRDLQISATDGFVTNLPSRLLFNTPGEGAVPWLAVEPADKPWPRTPEGNDIGPFYLVWLDPAASGVRSEQWPYQVGSMRTVPSRAAQWPQLMVGDDVSANSPIRAGQAFVVTQCMVCHRMAGAGDATVGPDLNRPHSPTEYFQPWALKALIRNPGSVRAWPEMKMHGFDESAMTDADLDAVISYLAYMSAGRH